MNDAHKITDPSHFTRMILEWYHQNARSLPWRETTDPYAIWVSETMLQQTRVETVIPYYARFLGLFPTVTSLAAAPEEAVLKAWEGLGYYRRARLLHQGAKDVVTRYNGKIPNNPGLLLTLPGVGAYMAGAIASIAFQLVAPAVDGNVIRVATRQMAWDQIAESSNSRLAITAWVKERFPRQGQEQAGAFTQSLMELGAIICLPRNPRCFICPVNLSCRGKGHPEVFPVKKIARLVPTERRTVLYITWNDKRLLLQRPAHGLMAGFWEYPNILISTTSDPLSTAAAWSEQNLGVVPVFTFQGRTSHQYTHVRWELEIYTARWLETFPPPIPSHGGWFTAKDSAALPRVAFVRKLQNIFIF